MKNLLICLMHKVVANAEFVRTIPKDFGPQPIICSPRVNLRYLYTGYESVDSDLLTVARHQKTRAEYLGYWCQHRSLRD